MAPPAPTCPRPICARILAASRIVEMAFDGDAHLSFFNEAANSWAARYFEAPLKLGMCAGDIFNREHREEFEKSLLRSLDGSPQDFHCSFIAGNVEERRFHVQFLPIPSQEGAIQGAFIEITQASPQAVLSGSIIHQDEMFRQLVQNSSDVMALLDENGTIRYLSPATEGLLGFPLETLVGSKAQDLIHPEDIQSMLSQNISAAFLPGARIALNYRARHADGTWLYLDSIISNLCHHPQIRGFVVNTRDVTERKMAEQARAIEKELLAVTLRLVGDAVIVTDMRGRVALLNNTAEALTGYSRRQADGRLLEEIYHVIDPLTSERLTMPLKGRRGGGSEDGGAPGVCQCVLVARDGSERPVSHSAAIIRSRAGNEIGMLVIFRDLKNKQRETEQKNITQQIESVGMLAGSIAHDFNNILLAITNNVSLARRSLSKNQDVRSRLEDAERASLRARFLTRKLLTFSKGGAPVLSVHRLTPIIRENAEFVLRGSHVEVKFDLAPGLSAVEVDAGQIGQVFNNLITNAMQAMPEGGSLRVTAHNVHLAPGNPHALPPGRYVHVSVSDNGPGIPSHIQDKLFDPFFTTKSSGSGLGLASSYSIVRGHCGAITFDSVEGEGATFHVILPATEKCVEEPTGELDEPGESVGRILIMDDDHDIRETMPLLLESYGYEVVAVPNGETLLEAYREAMGLGRPFSLVVMDLIVHGGMGGREAAARLKEMDPGAVAIISSGYSDDSTMRDYRKFGFDGVLAKPYRIEDLVRAIQKSLRP